MKRRCLRAGRVSYGHKVQSVAARSLVHKFLQRSPAWTKPKRLMMGLLWALCLVSISERFNSTRKFKKKNKKVILENCQSQYRRNIYLFLFDLSVFTKVVQWIEALTFSNSWLWGSGFESNGITSHYSGQPRAVTSSYKYAAQKKNEKANPFWSSYYTYLV